LHVLLKKRVSISDGYCAYYIEKLETDVTENWRGGKRLKNSRRQGEDNKEWS
jgi:hypothetical protein